MGKTEQVSFRADKSLIDILYDKFGNRIKMTESQDNTVVFTADVQVSPTFLAWCCAFGDKLKVTSPKTIASKVLEYINTIEKIYSEEKQTP